MSERSEHLAWCKERAFAYLDAGDRYNAVASFVSDMNKHDATARQINGVTLGMGSLAAVNGTDMVRRWIEGF